jgi:hypothetical protein
MTTQTDHIRPLTGAAAMSENNLESLADEWERRASRLHDEATRARPGSTIGASSVGLADGHLRCARELRDAIRGIFPAEVVRDLAVERALEELAGE